MKKYLVVISVLLLSGNAFTQTINFSINAGYNAGNANFDGLNFVIDRYNNTRSYLTKRMDKVDFVKGLSFGIGMGFTKVNVDLSYNMKSSSEASAEGVVNGTAFRRDLKTSINTFNVGFDYLVSSSRSLDTRVGASLGFGSSKVFTRVYPTSQAPAEYQEVNDISPGTTQSLFAISIFPKFTFYPGITGLSLYIKPFYEKHLTDVDYSNVNAVINPVTYVNDPSGSQKSKPDNYGAQIGISYGFR
jgi:hypothetical protein